MITNYSKRSQAFWLGRYDYDFAAFGIPGLILTLRYNKSDDAKVVSFRGVGRERELNTDLGYVVQSGVLKNIGIRWRYGTLRSNYQRDADQDRLIVDYSFKF